MGCHARRSDCCNGTIGLKDYEIPTNIINRSEDMKHMKGIIFPILNDTGCLGYNPNREYRHSLFSHKEHVHSQLLGSFA